MVYGTEVVVPTEIAIPSARITLGSKVDYDMRLIVLEALDEKRDRAKGALKVYQTRITHEYDAMVPSRQLKEDDLVLKAAPQIMRNMSAPKFSHK